MKEIGHHDEFMDQELVLTTIVVKSVNEKTRHALCPKKRAPAPRAGSHKIRIRSEGGTIARRLGHLHLSARRLLFGQLISTAGSRALPSFIAGARSCLCRMNLSRV